jgi:hypothetical protein
MTASRGILSLSFSFSFFLWLFDSPLKSSKPRGSEKVHTRKKKKKKRTERNWTIGHLNATHKAIGFCLLCSGSAGFEI